jgi:hypothetical protein
LSYYYIEFLALFIYLFKNLATKFDNVPFFPCPFPFVFVGGNKLEQVMLAPGLIPFDTLHLLE